jgi:hypothetical protein
MPKIEKFPHSHSKKIFDSEYFQKVHAERMLIDVPYISGFNGNCCDFIYPEAEGAERARICSLELPLDENQKIRLEELNKIIDGSDWTRWNDGEFAKDLFEQFENKT